MTAKVLWQDLCPGRLREEIVDDILRVTSFSEDPPIPPPADRVSEGLQVLYTFEQGAGRLIHDVSGVGIPLDLILDEEAAASWLSDGGLAVESPAVLASEHEATKIIDAVKSSNEISLEAWIRPANVTQNGPARILALSGNALTCNVLLGQATDLYEIRLRTTDTTEGGKPAVTTPAGALTEKRTHAVYTRNASGQVRIYLDGVVVKEQSLGGNLQNWAEGYRLALANELEGGRGWLGEFHLVAVYNRALHANEVIQNYEAGGGIVPDPQPDPDPPDDDPPPLPTGQIYYVSKKGNDNGNGSVGSPWLTISKANRTLKAGESVYLGEGTYNEFIEPENSGTAGNPIIYMADPANNGDVILAGQAGTAKMIRLSGDYITVEGLHIEWSHSDPGTRRWEWVVINGDKCTLQNCTITRDGDPFELWERGYNEFAVSIYGDDCLVTGCHVSILQYGVTFRKNGAFRSTLRNSVITNVAGACVNVFDSNYKIRGALIDNCVLGPCVTGDGVQWHEGEDAGSYTLKNCGTVVRNCAIKGCGENALDLKGAAHVLIENNTMYGNSGSNNGPGDGWNRSAHQTISVGGSRIAGNVVIRNNVIFDSCAGVEIQGDDYKIYHNTFIINNRDFTGPNSTVNDSEEPLYTATKLTQKRSKISFRNNIVASHNIAEVTLHLSDSGSGYDIDHNLYYNPAGVLLARQRTDAFDLHKFAAWKNLLAGFDTVSGKDAHSLEANPQLVDVPNYPTGEPGQYDFRIRATSPARNAAGPLTLTDGSGSNKTVVTVQDAAFFADGYRVTSGDRVKVGGNDSVRIISVDYGKNQLTLASPISWNNKDPVYLGDFEGSAPDIGAFEYGST